MSKREPPTLIRQHLPANRGRAGWRNAIVIEPGLEGIPLTPEPDLDLAPEPELVAPCAPSILVDGEPLVKRTARRRRKA